MKKFDTDQKNDKWIVKKRRTGRSIRFFFIFIIFCLKPNDKNIDAEKMKVRDLQARGNEDFEGIENLWKMVYIFIALYEM